jgi:hypothetical protein
MPFIVASAIVGILAWQLGWRPRHLAARAWAALRGEAATPGDPSPSTHTETT